MEVSGRGEMGGMRKRELCLEARCLPAAVPAREALRFVARAVKRFRVIVWTDGGDRSDALSVRERLCRAMVEDLGRQRGYGRASLVKVTHELPETAIIVTAERLSRAKGWAGLEARLDKMRAAQVARHPQGPTGDGPGLAPR